MDEPKEKVYSEFFDSFELPEDILRSEWAERHRRLSPEASSKAGGLFSFEMFPWQREPMDMIDSPNYGRMVLMWASQVTGKTETINNLIGSQADLDPCPILMIQPTVDLGQMWSKDRCDPMFRDTPRLRNLIKPHKSRDSGNTILHKQFPGGRLTIVGANAPRQLASRPIRIVLCDEIDGYPESAGQEGDPIKLAERRTESFSDAFVVLTSTPLIKGVSRIEREFIASDQRFWNVPCIRCGELHVLQWSQIKWDNDDPTSARMQCPHCRAELDDNDRRKMAQAGQWIPTHPGRKILGYNINGINVLLQPKRPWKTRLQQMVAEHIEAQRNEEERKTWVNTFLAETYEPPAEKHEPAELLKRRENYKADIPEGGLILVKSVDVQGDRLEVFTGAFGLGDECWGVDYRVIAGDPQRAAVWNELADDIRQPYTHETGHEITPAIVAIDQGDKTGQVRAFVRKHQPLCIAVKGDPKAGSLPFRYQKTPVQGLRPYMLGTDTLKDRLFAFLKIKEMGPGYHHFPIDEQRFGKEFFDQLTAEKAVIEFNKAGQPKRVYKKDKHARNEALDLLVYAHGAFGIYKYHRRPDLEYIAQQLEETTPGELTAAGRVYELRPSPKRARRNPDEPATDRPKKPRRKASGAGGFVKGWRRK